MLVPDVAAFTALYGQTSPGFREANYSFKVSLVRGPWVFTVLLCVCYTSSLWVNMKLLGITQFANRLCTWSWANVWSLGISRTFKVFFFFNELNGIIILILCIALNRKESFWGVVCQQALKFTWTFFFDWYFIFF